MRAVLKSRVSLYDVARAAQVSYVTVSNVLNRPGYDRLVAPPTRQRVRHAAERLGYVPNRIARSLASGKTYAIVLTTYNSLRYAHVHELFEEIELALAPHGYHLNLELLQHAKDSRAIYRSLTTGRCDGVIAQGGLDGDLAELQALRRQGVPVVRVHAAPSPDLDSVYYDMEDAAAIGTRHLLEQGHRRLAFVLDANDGVPRRARIRGIERALAARRLKFARTQMIPWKADADAGLLWERIRELRSKPTALLVYNPELGASLSRTVRAAGVAIPRELAMVVWSETPWSRHLDVPLTAIDTNYRGIAGAVVERLLAQIRDSGTPAKQILVKPSLVVRESSSNQVTGSIKEKL